MERAGTARRTTGFDMRRSEDDVDILRIVDRIAHLVPDVPRLAILDVVEAEWDRLCAAAEPYLQPLVLPAALWRLRAGADPFVL